MKRVLFLIRDLGHGGAEKVLVNLVNHMDPSKFDISVIALFGGGVNEQFLAPHVHFRSIRKRSIPGNSHLMKLLSPKQLHKLCVKEHYDIEVSYLEGPSARIISGCPHKDTKLACWLHCTMHSQKELAQSFRTKKEALQCYRRFDALAFVSKEVKQAFLQYCPTEALQKVLYNTNQSDLILEKAKVPLSTPFPPADFHWCGIGKLDKNKGFDRMLRIQNRLVREGYRTCLHIMGAGPMEADLRKYVAEEHLDQCVCFEGYQTNPYRYLRHCDLFVCASHSEGFSTAATEALIVGPPVCTVEVSGMKEMLGDNNEYGIVTENNEDALYKGIKQLLDDPKQLQHYTKQAALRGKDFSTEVTVHAVESMFLSL